MTDAEPGVGEQILALHGMQPWVAMMDSLKADFVTKGWDERNAEKMVIALMMHAAATAGGTST